MKILKKIFRFFIRPFLHYFYTQAGLKMAQDLTSYLKKGDKVLDLGCGIGFVGFVIAKKLGVEVIGTDVRDVREVDLPFVITNGQTLPFPDKEFDVVLIAYVLHHTPNTKEILAEAKRVCKRKILIYEDTPQTLVHRISCFIHGFSYGSLFGLAEKCKFRDRQEWLRIFTSLGFKILYVSKTNFFNPIHTTSRTLFVLAHR